MGELMSVSVLLKLLTKYESLPKTYNKNEVLSLSNYNIFDCYGILSVEGLFL